MRSVVAFYNDCCFEAEEYLPWTEIDPDEYEQWRSRSDYNSADPLIRYRSATVRGAHAAARAAEAVIAAGTTIPTNRVPHSQHDNFIRSIKRDASQYKPLKNEDTWDDWHRNFKTTARVHRVHDVLDSSYVPNTQDEILVWEEQLTFLYSVFENNLLTDFGKSLV